MDKEIPHRRKMPPEFYKYMANLFLYLKTILKFKSTPKVKLVYDKNNADYILGKTGYYDRNTDTIVLYVLGRHMKDILRSYSHELRHKFQHENNLFNINNEHDCELGYAQRNQNLRDAEADAFQNGSLLFRDFEDQIKYGKNNVLKNSHEL